MISWVEKSDTNVYLRLHGRWEWCAYEHDYNEFKELAERALRLSPGRIYVFFNNDHWMLENAKMMLNMLKSL